MLPYITIFGKIIPVYGICFFSGLCISVFVAWLLSKKRNILGYDVIYASVIGGIGAIIGSKVLFLLINLKPIIEMKISLLDAFKGGFVFYGGLIGGIVGLIIYVKKYGLDIITFFDLFATVVPLGHAIGRIGCFCGGCCYGIEYDGPLHCMYHINIGNTPLNTPLLPLQLIESFCLLCLFIVLVILYSHNPPKGMLTITYALSYSVIRFVLEFFRGDVERGFFLGLSTSQIISLLIFISTLLFIKIRKNRKYKIQINE